MHDLFISYARADEALVERLHADLVETGLDVWWDRETMRSRGRTFPQEIQDGVIGSDRLLLVVSGHIDRPYVHKEWALALEHCKVVVPVLVDGDADAVPPPLRSLHAERLRPESYRDDLGRVLRILRDPVAPLGPMFGVDPLPVQFLPRPEEVERLRHLVVPDTTGPTVVTSMRTGTAISGMGGIGKTVLAATFARDCATRRAFGDGIIWAKLGRNPDLTSSLRSIGRALDDPRVDDFRDRRAAEACIARLLEDRECLIVLDDAWSAGDVEPVQNVLGPRCRLLITSRQASLARTLTGQQLPVDVLTDRAALALLANWVGTGVDELPPVAAEVAAECGHLPLALALCGAMARDGVQWRHLLEALQDTDLDYIERALPHYDHPSLLRSIDVGVAALREGGQDELADAYLSLAVFPDGRPIPEAAIGTFWTNHLRWTERAVDRALAALEGRALLVRRDGMVILHDLQHDYLRARVVDRTALHASLVGAYERPLDGPGLWSTGVDDGYYFEHLVAHLAGAGRSAEARGLLLDFDWLHAVVTSCGAPALVAQYDALPADPSSDRVGDVLRLTAHVLAADSTQLAPQLLATLLDDPDPEVERLLERAGEVAPRPWLRPRLARLSSPGDGLVRTLEGHADRVNAVRFLPDGRRAVSCSREGSIIVWDLERGEAVERMDLTRRTMETDWNRIERDVPNFVYDVALVAGAERIVSSSVDDLVRVWDIRSGEILMTLEGHEREPSSLAAVSDRTVVSASSDRIILWDISEGTPLQQVTGPNRTVTCLAASPDGRHLVWGVAAGLEVRDPETLELLRTIEVAQEVSAVAVGDDGLVVAVTDDLVLHGWDIWTSAVRHSAPISHPGLGAERMWHVADVALVTGGRALVATGRGTFLCPLDGSGEAIRVSDRGVACVDVLADGSRAVAGLDDGKVQVWDLQAAGRAQRAPSGPSSHVAFSPGGDRLFEVRRGRLVCWDVAEAAELWSLPAPEEDPLSVTALAVTADGRRVVTGSDDGTVRIFDVAVPALVHELAEHGRRVVDVDTSPDGTLAVSASHDETAIVWDLVSGNPIAFLEGHAGDVDAVSCSPDGTRVVTASADETLKVWRLPDGDLEGTLYGHPHWIDSVRFLPTGHHVICTSGRMTPLAVVWDVEAGETLFQERAHSPVATSSAGLVVAANTTDIIAPAYSVGVWDLDTGRQTHRFEGLTGEPVRLAFSPDGGLLLFVGEDGKLLVWRLDDGELVATYDGERPFTDGSIAPNGVDIAAVNALGLHMLCLEP